MSAARAVRRGSGVETHRAEGVARAVGEALWDWGVPTAASVSLLSDLNLQIIATGGLRSGLDVAAAIALGARAGGLAAPVLKAWKAGGYDGAVEYLRGVIETVKAVTFLTGCRTPAELCVGAAGDWIDATGLAGRARWADAENQRLWKSHPAW